MGSPRSNILIGIPSASFDGNYYSRYPRGDKPAGVLTVTLDAQAVSTSAVQLTATVDNDPGEGLLSYRFERSLNGTDGWVVIQPAWASSDYLDTGLSIGTEYFYRAMVSDHTGVPSAYSLVSSAQTTGGDSGEGWAIEGTVGRLRPGAITRFLRDSPSNSFSPAGPNTLHLSTFHEGTHGSLVTASSPQIGTYYETNDSPRFTNEFSRVPGGTSLHGFNGALQTRVGMVRTQFAPINTQQRVRLRWWGLIPTGKAKPACPIGGHTASRSAWKMTWIGGDRDMTIADVCVPTAYDGRNLGVGGNSTGMGARWTKYPDNQAHYDTYFPYGRWNMTECLLDGINYVTKIGHCVTIGNPMYSRSSPNFWGPELQYLSHLNVPGWVHTGGYPDTEIYYSDVSVAAGDGAFSEIVLGNNPVITACTDLKHGIVHEQTEEYVDFEPLGIDDYPMAGWFAFARGDDGVYIPYNGSLGRAFS